MTKRSRRHQAKPMPLAPLLSVRRQISQLLKPVFGQLSCPSADCARATCQSLLEQPLLILDIEANGARHASEIVEIGMIDGKGKVVYHSLVHAARACTPHAFAVHHIPEAALENAPAFDSLWPEIRALLLSANVVSFDIRSDMAFLTQTLALNRIVDAELSGMKLQCAMQLYRSYRQSQQCIGLKQACQELGITKRQKHRVVDDCRLTLKLLERIAAGAPIVAQDLLIESAAQAGT